MNDLKKKSEELLAKHGIEKALLCGAALFCVLTLIFLFVPFISVKVSLFGLTATEHHSLFTTNFGFEAKEALKYAMCKEAGFVHGNVFAGFFCLLNFFATLACAGYYCFLKFGKK